MNTKQLLKEAKSNKYYPPIKDLLTKYDIKVKKWVEFEKDTGQTFHADMDVARVLIPIPVCSESAYICLHEIGHVLKGDRQYVYLCEYHAELYAIREGKKMKLRHIKRHESKAKKYVFDNLLEDVLFRKLNPNSVRREVRRWLGVTPLLIKNKALKRAHFILKHLESISHCDYSVLSGRERALVADRLPVLEEIIIK